MGCVTPTKWNGAKKVAKIGQKPCITTNIINKMNEERGLFKNKKYSILIAYLASEKLI